MPPPPEPSIAALFTTAVTRLVAIDPTWPALTYLVPKSSASTDPLPAPAATSSAKQAIASLEHLSAAVQSAALLSANESLDEIPTRSLKLLLLPLLQARAHAQVQGDAPERHAALSMARRLLLVFFERMDKLGLLAEHERDLVLEGTPVAVVTPAEKREQKIVRYKLEKEAGKKLAMLRERGEVEEDEEVEREAMMVLLGSASRGGIEMIGGVEEEMTILEFAVRERERGGDPRERAEREREGRERKERGRRERAGGMPVNYRIVSGREKAKEEVFRPSHSLPTYTVEEWGEMEMRRMVQAEKEKRERQDAIAAGGSDGEEAGADRETMEKRKWDDWADDHNRGSGNSKR